MGDLATDNMHAGRSGCVELTALTKSKWDDPDVVPTDYRQIYYLYFCPKKQKEGGHVSWGRAWRDSHLTDFFCFKGVCARQLTVRICI